MSRGINKIILIGHIGQDPEKVSGQQITKISVATSEKWKDKKSGEQMESTEWHRCTFFGHLANSAMKYLYKGAKVYIEGKNVTNKWEKDGQTHYTTEIHVRSYLLLSENRAGNQDNNSGNAQAGSVTNAGSNSNQSQNSAPAVATANDGFDDDIPF